MDRALIHQMAEAGFCFVACDAGMTSSRIPHWQEVATSSKTMIDAWLSQGFSLVAVAKRDNGFLLDLDDTDALLEKGFNPKWLSGYFAVDTPSGGVHVYGLSDVKTDALPNLVVVHATKGDKKSKKILELKIAVGSVAAPTAERKGVENKCDGVYKPRKLWAGTKAGLRPELLEWLKQHAESVETKTQTKLPWDFHPDFEMADFLENEGCVELTSGDVDETFHVAVQECPHCGHASGNSTLRAARVKFIFAGKSYGFKCHACGVESREKHKELMQEKDPSYECWSEPIYTHDDMELMTKKMDKEGLGGLAIEEIDPVEPLKKVTAPIALSKLVINPSARRNHKPPRKGAERGRRLNWKTRHDSHGRRNAPRGLGPALCRGERETRSNRRTLRKRGLG